MIVTPSTLSAAFLAFDTLFQGVYTQTPVYWNQIASRIPSMTKEQRHAWLKKLPELREWIGERQIENLSVNMQTLVNKKFEKTFGIDQEDFEDDIIGVYTPSVQMLAEQSRKWPDKLVVAALQAGASNVCHDGLNFFSASHLVNPDDAGSGTQSNYYSSGKALTPDNYDIVRQAMRALKGEDGVPLEINPDLIVVPPQLETKARQIVEAEYLAATSGIGAATGSSVNVLKGTAKVLVIPRLANESTRWYLMDTTRAVKPFIFQDRVAPQFTYLNKPDDSNVFLQDKFLFGVRARGNAGYGPWFLAASAQT